MDRMNEFALLDDAARAFGDDSERGSSGDTGRRRQAVSLKRGDGALLLCGASQ